MDGSADNSHADPVSTEGLHSPSSTNGSSSPIDDQEIEEPRSSMERTKVTALLPQTSTIARELAKVKLGEEGTGVILIGMDNIDGAMTDRTTTESRRSSIFVDHRPSETNDTDHEDDDEEDIHKTEKDNYNEDDPSSDPIIRRSLSSSSRTGRPAAIPVMLIDRRRSTSTSSTSSTASSSSDSSAPHSTSLRHRTSSLESSSKQPQPRHTQRTDRPHHPGAIPQTTPSTEDPSIISHSRRPSATEFQKFRDQLHQQPTPITPTFPTVATQWQLHPNPHHPKTRTEVLRIERIYTPIELPSKTHVSEVTNYDVLIPRFSPAFPPILREYGIVEGEWTGFIGKVNKTCMEAFDPFRWSNIILNLVNVLSFWMTEWIMPNITKRVNPWDLLC